jgi:hypothetical protein
MAIEIRPARGDDELRQAYTLRAQVFGGEGILQCDDRSLLIDEFDALPSSETVVAVQHGAVVGTVRRSWHDGNLTPCDHYFTSSSVLPTNASIGSGSLLCVAPSKRSGTLGLRLVDWVMYDFYEQGITHGLAPIRPQAEPIFRRLGWYMVGELFKHPVERVPVFPMGVTLADRFGHEPVARLNTA